MADLLQPTDDSRPAVVARRRKAVQFAHNRLFALIVFIIALAATITSCLLVPPNQIPDEPNHFFRATQLSLGSLIGSKGDGQSGAVLPTNTLFEAGAFTDLIGHPERKASLAALHKIDWIDWNTRAALVYYPNTVTYGPGGYVPQALAVLIGRLGGLTVMHSFYLARLFAALAFAALAAGAVALCRGGALFLALVVTLPMSLFLAGSVSQDGIILGLSALLAAALTRTRAGERWPVALWALMGVGFGILGMAKPPCVALAGIALFAAPPRDWKRALACPLVAIVLTFGWLAIGVAPVKVPLLAGAQFSESGQTMWVLHHPLQFARVLFDTAYRDRFFFADTLVGRFGWLDTFLPPWLYPHAIDLLGLTLLGAFAASRRAPARTAGPLQWGEFRLGLLRTAGVSAILAVYGFGVFLALYITWTPVGAPLVEGVQGRYFLPALCFVACLLPQRAPLGPTRAMQAGRIVVFLGWATMVAVVCVPILWQRYW